MKTGVRSSPLRNLFISFLSTLIWIALLEITLRLIPIPLRDEFLNERFNITHKGSAVLSETHPIFGGWNKKNSEGIIERREYKMKVHINDKGLRDKERTYQKSSSRYRILFLGDSFTFGTGVEQGQTFVSLLEQKLSPAVETINGGAPGFSTVRESLFFRYEGIKYSPDLVILCFFQNDIQDNYDYYLSKTKSKSLASIQFFFLRAYNKLSISIQEGLYGRSAIYAAVTYLKRNFLLPYTISNEEFRVTQRYLNEIKEVCDLHKMKLTIVYIPRREELRKKNPEHLTATFLKKYCEQRQIPFLNLWTKFREYQQRNLLYFPLDTHFSPHGHRVTSEFIQTFLEEPLKT